MQKRYPNQSLNPIYTPAERLFVRQQAAKGGTDRDIAALIRNGIPLSEFRMSFGREYSAGLAQINIAIADEMRKHALSGDLDAGKFWLSRRADWATVDARQRAVAQELNTRDDTSEETSLSKLSLMLDITPDPTTPCKNATDEDFL